MKKLLLILLCPILLLTSCSKSGVTPQVEANIKETIVGKTWKLLDTDYGWFHLNDNNTYLTKDYLCDSLEQFGTWKLEGSVLIFTYTDGPIEYIERNTIISYSDSLVKIQADTSATLNINILFEIVTADVITGCMNSTFSNFNPNAECPDTCTNAPVYGCMDAAALNYDATANIDDGSCCYVYGCMDATALNFDPNACIDDGSCCYVYGCMDATALNYNTNACQDDGSCCYVYGCMDATALNYNTNACQDDGSCCYVEGCMDATALNYDVSACFDDGSCTYLAIGNTYQGGIVFWLDGNGGGLISAPTDQSNSDWGCFGTWISGADGTAIGTGVQNTIDIVAGCATSGTAADICANLTLGGYNDWFLPSIDELNEMHLNIGRGNALGLGNVGGFLSQKYWSSTEYNNDYARVQSFANGGGQYNEAKHFWTGFTYLRAVRAF